MHEGGNRGNEMEWKAEPLPLVSRAAGAAL
jgi:hypothetical protein